MANDVRVGREIVFADGEVRKVFPLTIRQLRKFLKAVKGLDTATTELSDEQIDQMISAAAVALEKDFPELAEDEDGLQDILDLKSFNELLGAAMGADPNE